MAKKTKFKIEIASKPSNPILKDLATNPLYNKKREMDRNRKAYNRKRLKDDA